ncbi:undecaprenyl-phosphate glucose phosphotransferase [Neptunomonas qingdaonensis]|uniref:Putative colanic acid biosysnthesis UDP-glucose lipid carrier transferase n=1 Tax=Neptunomonas qingdaonensis TaxID=1045558 RepID=A0A1I2VSU8_9GAMM|nr:undecaprenyl-phosphate glucose phosphotransferase [Neptunomonas qingdaonensis]SFG92364.1 putative colanic acid biosysnthesis UDP-glucose lipid carrier transferase [Neptunomonas qingdaonensis]
MELGLESNKLSSSPMGRQRRLLRNHETLMFWAQLFADVFIVIGSLGLLTYWNMQEIPPYYRFLAIIIVLALFAIYSARGVYRRSSSLWRLTGRLTIAWSLLLFLLLCLGFITKTTDMFSRQVLLIWAPTALGLQLVNHLCLNKLIKHYHAQLSQQLPVIIVGAGNIAQHLVNSLTQNRWLPDRVMGIVVANNDQLDPTSSETLPSPVLGVVANLRTIIKQHGIRRIYIALPLAASEQIESLHIDLLDMNVDVIWAPDIFALNLLNHSVREVAGVPLISLNESPLTSSRVSIVIKGIMDRVLALAGLLMLSPLFIAIAILVKRSSPGPVFFKQQRHGFDGKLIEIYKFRSMKLHNDAEIVKQATKEDPRVTKIGKFIRKSSIDELPQLFNVLNGTMSLVGPRPHAVSHNDYYSDKINAYLARHRIKPGITGLAQIKGYRGETETLEKMQKRVELDLAYINNWSLSLDIKILIKTPFSLISKNIY